MTHRLEGPEPTQVRRPWRTTARSVVAATLGLLPLLPALAASAGIETVPAVITILGVTAIVTRITATPGVEGWLRRWAPWLSAAPPREENTP